MRWDEPILGKAEINIEYISTKNPEWELIQKHQFEIWDAVYDGNSLTASSEISEKRELFDFDKELKKRHEQNKK